MSVPLCHSSGGSLKETNEKHQFQLQINVFFSLLNWKKKHFSLYRHCRNFCLPYADWLFFFFENTCCLLVFLCRVQYFSTYSISSEEICNSLWIYHMKHSHFCRTFISNCEYSSNDLPFQIFTQSSWCIPFLLNHCTILLLCVCVTLHTLIRCNILTRGSEKHTLSHRTNGWIHKEASRYFVSNFNVWRGNGQ